MKKTCLIAALSVWMCGCDKIIGAGGSAVPQISFLGRTYHLGSYNQIAKPTWEFITGDEKIDNWTSLVTLIDRTDAQTPKDLDGVSEGVMANYKSHLAQILMAKTFPNPAGAYNYLAAAFEEPDKHRFEMNFVKIGLGPKNVYVVIYGARVSDPQDYVRKGKDFLNRHSGEIGDALAKFVLPDLNTLPRKVF
jgi:hypothetical protein